MSFLSLIFFIFLALSLGLWIELLIKREGEYFERIVFLLGFSICSIPLIGVFLNFVKAINYKCFLFIGAINIILFFWAKKPRFKKPGKLKFHLSKRHIPFLFVLLLFIATWWMYGWGAFNQPYFEDGDPWGYIYTSKYISEFNTYSAPFRFQRYAEPYPQGYQIFMGLMHQSNNSLWWTFKFFHPLVISLSILFFFIFVRRFTRDKLKALFATIILFSIPAWVSRFTFPLSFNVALVPLFLYSLSRIDENKRWAVPSLLILASLWVSHFHTAVVATGLAVIFLANNILSQRKNSRSILLAIIGGTFLSLFFWIPALARHWPKSISALGGAEIIIKRALPLSPIQIFFILAVFLISLFLFLNKRIICLSKSFLSKKYAPHWFAGVAFLTITAILLAPLEILKVKGSGTNLYDIGDFFFANAYNNLPPNPRGLGPIVFVLLILALVKAIKNCKRLFQKENFWLSTTLFWFLFSVLSLFGKYFSIEIAPFRMWSYFAIPVSILAGWSLTLIFRGGASGGKRVALTILLTIFILLTSFYPKCRLQTELWAEHYMWNTNVARSYMWLKDNLPKNSKVYPFCVKDEVMAAADMRCDYLNKDAKNYRKTFLNHSAQENYLWLKKQGFDYTAIDVSCMQVSPRAIQHYKPGPFEPWKVIKRLGEFMRHPQMKPIFRSKTTIIFAVN